jgi:pyrimidine-nucleoside phosphorylase
MSEFRATEFLRQKRDGERHSPEALAAFVAGIVRGEVADYQVSAWLMAAYLRGLDAEETAALTEAMWRSGESLPRRPRGAFRVDKHSTGGVGDKTSVLLVPWVLAAATRLGVSAVVPMISGRGLGITGGTLDKLDSIPGYRTAIDADEGVRLLETVGGFIGGPTARTAPADRVLYALRDVTATVESIPLITASILSKKLSASLDGLVLDVKFGEGAFMRDVASAEALAGSLVRVASAHGVRTAVVFTAMDDLLGFSAGNALEVRECAEFFDGVRRSVGLETVTRRLAVAMLCLASPALAAASAERALEETLADGTASARFRQWVAAQGGDLEAARRQWDDAPGTRRVPIVARASGPLRLPAGGLGKMLVAIGAGRARKEDRVRPDVGLWLSVEAGTPVRAGETLGWLAVDRDVDAASVQQAVEQRIGEATARGEAPGPWVLREWVAGAAGGDPSPR